MRKFPTTALDLTLVLALLFTLTLTIGLSGCHKSQPNAAGAQQSATDPAEANLAYASNTQTAEQTPPPPPPDNGNTGSTAPNGQALQQGYPSGPAYSQNPPADQGQPADQGYYDQDAYDNEPPVYADEPPPPLPNYEQPDCPGDDYLWTPGYWAWSPAGYYWVPGSWVLAPYLGALWTPGYWGFYSGRYRWYHGYWGPHIGYYGGVNYGYGYNGAGYEGGYWNHDHFEYNRAVTRVGGGIRNAYSYPVNNRFNSSRISYNGGRGGLNYRPTASQLAAARETHLGALPAQREQERSAAANRGQFAAANHGRPAMVVESRGLSGGRSAPGAPPANFHAAPSMGRVETNPAVGRGGPDRGAIPGRPDNNVRPAINRGAAEPGAGARPETRPETGAPYRSPNRGANQPEYRSAPARPQNEPNRGSFRAQPQPQYRPQPQEQPRYRPESRPQPQPQYRPPAQPQYRQERPQPEARPAPQQRPESRPAPAPRPEPQQRRPEPQQRPEPRPESPHGDNHRR
jgi:WXXGXW repeat (2 copies)